MLESPQENALVRTARQEAWLVAGLWISALIWSVGYSYLNGYGATTDKLQFTLGFPSWIFWGVVAPWVLCAVLSLFITRALMTDEELGGEPPEEEF
jgi:hypothetical protein